MVYGPPAGFVRNKPSVYIDRDYCTGCMKCVRLCPQKHVLEPARDEHGLFCSDVCADAHAEDLHEAAVAWGLANGYVRPTHPNRRAAA